MTEEALKKQLAWAPPLEGPAPAAAGNIIVGGMGGSALPAYAARFLDNAFPVSVHGDYDFPEYANADTLYVAISYSGNTAETLSFAKAVRERGLPLAVIASGGALAGFAREAALPLIIVPGGMPPRDALFYLLRAFLLIAGRTDLLDALATVSVDTGAAHAADALADALAGGLPIFYASRKNGFLAREAKVQMNETAKMPAFANVFPELNHNEMESFDTPAPEDIVALARFVLLRGEGDDARIARRMDLFAELMRSHGRRVTDIPLLGETRADILVYGWLVAYRAALALAERRGVNPDAVPLVEDFKKRL